MIDDTITVTHMPNTGNIVITDESALHAWMNCDFARRAESLDVIGNPLNSTPSNAREMKGFNLDNPLYGKHPVKLLVASDSARYRNSDIECRIARLPFPRGSFIKLRDGLYVTSPELTFARMADRLSDVRLAEVATALCGGYYLKGSKIEERVACPTSIAELRDYLQKLPGLQGRGKAVRALGFAKDNSGSPLEGKTMLQLCMPLRTGGFNLPFDYMNFDIQAGRCRAIAEQNDFCIDLVSSKSKIGIEYDGVESHTDSSKDKRRRNMLMALGWKVFPLEKDVLYNPVLTEKFALQVAKFIGYRIQRRPNWDEAYVNLRHELDLPA